MSKLPNFSSTDDHYQFHKQHYSTAMAAASLSSLNLLPPSKLSSTHAHLFPKNTLHIPLFPRYKTLKSKPLTRIAFALTDSPKSLDPDPQILLKELAGCFVLPSDYFKQLPKDLRLDLNDAAFDLSNGPVKDECGEELGETLLNISRAWELADTLTSASLMSKLPSLVGSATSNNKSALGKRLVSVSRRFQCMGQYGQGELQMIAKVMNRTGQLLSTSPVSEVSNDEPKEETKVLKFGNLQVELTPGKAYSGAVIGVFFGILSWQLSQGIQSVPESSLEYANDNALLLAKSLRGALLAICYSSTILSGFAAVGLVLLGGRLKSKDK